MRPSSRICLVYLCACVCVWLAEKKGGGIFLKKASCEGKGWSKFCRELGDLEKK